MDFTVGFVSQNLVTHKIFVEFRDSQIFSIFETLSVRWIPKMRFLRKKKNSKLKNELVMFILK